MSTGNECCIRISAAYSLRCHAYDGTTRGATRAPTAGGRGARPRAAAAASIRRKCRSRRPCARGPCARGAPPSSGCTSRPWRTRSRSRSPATPSLTIAVTHASMLSRRLSPTIESALSATSSPSARSLSEKAAGSARTGSGRPSAIRARQRHRVALLVVDDVDEHALEHVEVERRRRRRLLERAEPVRRVLRRRERRHRLRLLEQQASPGRGGAHAAGSGAATSCRRA